MGSSKEPRRIIDKPWGQEIILAHTEKYLFKRIIMRKGTRSSLQSHRIKHESLFILSGTIILEFESKPGNGLTKKHYVSGQVYTIKPGCKHRVTVLEDCDLFEVSTPELDDVIRHDDDYGRS